MSTSGAVSGGRTKDVFGLDGQGNRRETDTEVSEDEEFPAQKEPNIRNMLKDVLENDSSFKRTFAFSQSYPEAPNPGLTLGDSYMVGIPLNGREAEEIKKRSAPTSFGKDERITMDANVRNTWEIDTSQVTFTNPLWKKFVSKVFKEVCNNLGIDVTINEPICKLDRLLLYQTGSHFLSHIDKEIPNATFATIVVVLPSAFTGGETHISHSDRSVAYDCSQKSHFDTTVLSWYTDGVKHEVKPITAGYRLALSYNVIHSHSIRIRPALPLSTGVTARLREILRSWKERAYSDSEKTPTQLLYLLEHKYFEKNLRSSALKGPDAHRFAALSLAAQEYGFGLVFARVDCMFNITEGKWGFLEACGTRLLVDYIVDVEGKIIAADRLQFNEDTDTIPVNLEQVIANEEVSEACVENLASQFTHSCERNVLVLLTPSSRWELFYGSKGGLHYACKEFEGFSEPTTENMDIAKWLISKASSPQCTAEVTKTLCQAAHRWDNVALWNDTIKGCSKSNGCETLPDDDKIAGIEKFGFKAVRSSLDVMLKNGSKDVPRLSFIVALRQRIDDTTEPLLWGAPVNHIHTWVNKMQRRIVESVKIKDLPLLLKNLARDENGLRGLLDTDYNQIAKAFKRHSDHLGDEPSKKRREQ